MRLSNYREYICLPEYNWITNLLQKGIAVHHGGVTPVFREMIEILFGLIILNFYLQAKHLQLVLTCLLKQ